jgi:hypothetical protein
LFEKEMEVLIDNKVQSKKERKKIKKARKEERNK